MAVLSHVWVLGPGGDALPRAVLGLRGREDDPGQQASSPAPARCSHRQDLSRHQVGVALRLSRPGPGEQPADWQPCVCGFHHTHGKAIWVGWGGREGGLTMEQKQRPGGRHSAGGLPLSCWLPLLGFPSCYLSGGWSPSLLLTVPDPLH